MKAPHALVEQYVGFGASISRSMRLYFLARAGSRVGRDLVAMLRQQRRRDFVLTAVLNPAGCGRW